MEKHRYNYEFSFPDIHFFIYFFVYVPFVYERPYLCNFLWKVPPLLQWSLCSSSSESRPLEVDKPRKESIFEFEEETLNFCQKTRKGVLEKEEGVFDDFPTHWKMKKERNYETIFCLRSMLRKEKVVVLLLRTKNRVGCTSFFFWQDPLREADVEGKRHLSPLIRGHFSPIGGDITASIDYKRRWSLP